MIILLIILLFVPVSFAEEIPTISISIEKEMISNNNVVIKPDKVSNSLNQSLLNNNIDIQRNTVHPNISLKGSTFQQSSIYIDGVKIDDPQTAHHNMNIPVTINDIERIEILNNKGLSGALNIITKKPDDAIIAEISVGDYANKNGKVTASRKWKNIANRLSIEKNISEGYSFDTDFDITNIFNQFEWSLNNLATGLSFGYLKKDFGAKGFYANFPSYEWTETYFSKVYLNYMYHSFNIKPEFQWRGNKDEFELDITKPGWSFNEHRTDVYTSQLEISKNNYTGGTSISKEKIDSSNLGNHSRDIYGLWSNYKHIFSGKINTTAGLQLDKYSNYSVLSPSIYAEYYQLEKIKIHSIYRKSVRQPSFTELYYNDKANVGNPNLDFEKATLYEMGINYNYFILNLFVRDEKDIIDWIKQNQADAQWLATNIGKAKFYGYEIGSTKDFNKISISLKYQFTNSSKDADFISKYALRYANHILTSAVSYSLPLNIKHQVSGLYKKRISGEEYFVLDTKFTKDFSIGEYFVKIDNILNREYFEIPFVEMPPRIIYAGLNFHI
ncbi:MAG: hypothetical protein A2551_01345 [Elusimicrobia bacterium RIFOXYD2_FULL_34_30]|nr:MAG: hypothetical protein A2551_01345 [Elusimicrobia bacterium RIFOXYD2_FULL_34_30]